jgi:hypothetical protein
MKTHTLLIAGSLLFGFAGAAIADDHLHEATQHGLSTDSTGFTKGDPAPGQDSPFSGDARGIPATKTEAARNALGVSGNDDVGLSPGKANPPSAESQPTPSANLK